MTLFKLAGAVVSGQNDRKTGLSDIGFVGLEGSVAKAGEMPASYLDNINEVLL
jgi:hypothetical protein